MRGPSNAGADYKYPNVGERSLGALGGLSFEMDAMVARNFRKARPPAADQ
jgi:hypothetical protein